MALNCVVRTASPEKWKLREKGRKEGENSCGKLRDQLLENNGPE